MPLTILACTVWTLALASQPAPIGSALADRTGAALDAPIAGPVLILAVGSGPTGPDRDGRPALWWEAEDEDERDDDTESTGFVASDLAWSIVPSRLGSAHNDPHPTLRPRSASRSPILRC